MIRAFVCGALCWVSLAGAEIEIPGTIHVLGLAGVARDSRGTLVVNPEGVIFRGERNARIPQAAVGEFAIARESRAAVRGTAGQLIRLAPFGAGTAVSMIRPGVDMVSLLYRDERRALHGCLLMLPKGRGAEVERFFEAAPQGHPPARRPVPTLPPAASKAVPDKYRILAKQLEVAPVDAGVTVPAEFRVAVYEQLVESMRACGLFANVWRAGDHEADGNPDRLVLTATIVSLQKGSARVRVLSPLGGATVVKARVRLLDRAESPILDREVTGAVRLQGESLNAADNLAKKVAELLQPKF